MNIEYQESDRLERGLLYSVEFPQASSTCEISFWPILRGGNSPLTASLLIDDEVEAVVFILQVSGNFSSWQSGFSIDLGTN